MNAFTSDSAPAVLVTARDPDLRNSLAFFLAAEGFFVATDSSWPREGGDVRCDVVVIDHGAFPKGYLGDEELARLGRKIVILDGRERALLPLPEATVIRKPLLDRILIDTLRDILKAEGTEST